MKKPRNVEPTKLNPKSSRNRVNKFDSDKKTAKKSFYDISVPLFFSFWCGVVLFHAKFGITRGNEGDLLGGIRNSECLRNNTVNVSENGYEKLPNGMVMEQDVSVVVEDFSIRNVHPNVEDLISGTNELEELLSIVLGYDSFTCQIESQEDAGKGEPEVQNGRIQLNYPNLDEFKHISSKEKSGSPRQLVNITHRIEPDGTPFNYASASKGAKVVAHNKEAKGASNILDRDEDKYLRNPCSVEGKFFIIELADETLVDAVKIANFEHHSSNFKDFELYGSLVYPTETWDTLGSFVAANSKHVQCFKLPEPKWVRYLKVNLLSHYGTDFYCTLNVVEVFGVDAIEQMLEDLIVPPAESSTNGLPNPNSTALPSIPEPSSNKSENGDVAHTVVEPVSKGVGSVDEGQNHTPDIPKKPVSVNSAADIILKARQLPNNRLHADAALKVLLQKVRSLELNLSVLEEYIKELNRRRVEYLPELDKELNKFSTLLERTKLEMKNLLEWKEIMENGILELESWRTVASTQMDILVNQNSMLRFEVEKVQQDQVNLESKGLAILTVSFCFVCIALLKIVLERLVKQFRAPTSGATSSSNGWILLLLFCSMTMLIPVLYALVATVISLFIAGAVIFRKVRLGLNRCDCACRSEEREIVSEEMTARVNGGASERVNGGASENGGEMAVERQSGASMMEQLVPEITTHALSYLDYPSLCRLSMTNSLMRKAANDDNAWKALYHKDFTLEQDNVTPPNGWKAYYAATRAIVTVNAEFFRIIRERSLHAMRQFWLNADYVKCFHATGESFSGYNAVMGSWQLAFNWENVADFQIQDVRARVTSSMAWVTMKAYLDIGAGPFNVTNTFELQNGRWYMVHHHCSAMLIHGGGGQQLLHV